MSGVNAKVYCYVPGIKSSCFLFPEKDKIAVNFEDYLFKVIGLGENQTTCTGLVFVNFWDALNFEVAAEYPN